uniref:Uncharacterized protein n=1 Tax=Pristionchus pacificus TaxID=54126 RepID=A0A2A6BZB0_PRIPA|eukprot:PDM71255.1 hypothetical protein PRIPAC_37662 [Pristionchus pacificus]
MYPTKTTHTIVIPGTFERSLKCELVELLDENLLDVLELLEDDEQTGPDEETKLSDTLVAAPALEGCTLHAVTQRLADCPLRLSAPLIYSAISSSLKEGLQLSSSVRIRGRHFPVVSRARENFAH